MGDVAKLQRDYSAFGDCGKTLELGNLCRRKGFVNDGRRSLQLLVASVLKKKLSKEEKVRCSFTLDKTLSDNQLAYAALDAWAGIEVFDRVSLCNDLEKVPVPLPLHEYFIMDWHRKKPLASCIVLKQQPPNGTKVSIASSDQSSNYCKKTSKNVMVNVVKVFVRAALHRNSNKTYTQLKNEAILINTSALSTKPMDIPGIEEVECDADEDEDDPATNDQCSTPISDVDIESGYPVLSSDYFVDGEFDLDDDMAPEPANYPMETEEEEVISPISDLSTSRILEDPFHILKSFNLPKKHGARVPFLKAFSEALFVVDENDKRAVSQAMEKANMGTWCGMLSRNPAWLWKRVRRTIPKPSVLHQSLFVVFQQYGNIEDSATGKKLFDDIAWKQSKTILKLVLSGKN